MPSILSHETAHALGAIFFDEAQASLLGWEIDARMILVGHERHRLSLCTCLRDMIFHVSYLRARHSKEIPRWSQFIKGFYGSEISQDAIDKNIKHFEKGEEENIFGERLSDYSLIPYLSIRGALKMGVSHVLKEYEMPQGIETETIEIPKLLSIWDEWVA